MHSTNTANNGLTLINKYFKLTFFPNKSSTRSGSGPLTRLFHIIHLIFKYGLLNHLRLIDVDPLEYDTPTWQASLYKYMTPQTHSKAIAI